MLLTLSCSNSSVDNFEDCDCLGESPTLPPVVSYDTLDSLEFYMPEAEYLPQYADWDTILCEYYADFKWNTSNLDSITLSRFHSRQPFCCLFPAIRGGKKSMFNEISYDYGNDTNLRNSIYDAYIQIGNQMEPKIVPIMLKKVYYLEDSSYKKNTWLKDSVGEVRIVVRLVPPRSK